MAYTRQNWCRTSASANEPIVTLQSGTVDGCFREYNYYTADTQAVVNVASYFDEAETDIATGDYVNVYSTTDNTLTLYRLTNTARVITTSFESAFLRTQTAVTAAQFNGMYAASVLLAPAPGANRMYVLKSFQATMTFATTQYAGGTGGDVHVQYTNAANGAGTQASTQTTAADILALAASSSWPEIPVLVVPALDALVVNAGLYLGNETAAFTTGDSPFVVNIAARIVRTA